MSGGIYIGTSGWNYGDWKGVFYPDDLKPRDFLPYYASQFSTVEVNYSFYRLPSATTYEKWAELTPNGFTFTLKASRFISHIKRLHGAMGAWRTFVKRADPLGVKRGPILVQLPPSFHRTDINLKRLQDFLKAFGKDAGRVAIEFRHSSWFAPEVYDILERANVSLVIADSSRYPNPPEETVTAGFVYFRFHGPTDLFASVYTNVQLEHFTEIIKKHHRQGKDVYAYFNNDFRGYAVQNARTLMNLLRS